jgi:hypothetical protein
MKFLVIDDHARIREALRNVFGDLPRPRPCRADDEESCHRDPQGAQGEQSDRGRDQGGAAGLGAGCAAVSDTSTEKRDPELLEEIAHRLAAMCGPSAGREPRKTFVLRLKYWARPARPQSRTISNPAART